MSPRTRGPRLAAEIAFYLLLLALFFSKAAVAGFSHDENQFIAPGQLLIDHGLLPYVDYPYTHMPYAAFFYGLSAALTDYDFLAGRLLNAIAWFLCALVIARAFGKLGSTPGNSPPFLWDFVVLCVFAFNSILGHIVGNALNHSLAALFSLLALASFVRGVSTSTGTARLAFGAGALASMACWTRLNYAVLVPVLGLLYLVPALRGRQSGRFRPLIAYGAGVLAAAIPALALFIAAPRAAFYGNYVYIRLNTIYYSELLYRVNMQLGQKLMDFLTYLVSSPVDLALYLLMLFMLMRSLLRYIRSASPEALADLALAGSALALAVTAFAPTPTQPQYFLAAIPLLCVCLLAIGRQLYQQSRMLLGFLAALGLLATFAASDARTSLASITALAEPSRWVPLQAHQFAIRLRDYVPAGRVLTLLPMFPLEAGYEVYPFAATGPFSWRTSLLLTAQRRLEYGVTSPEELPAVLGELPPQAVLTGFESTNPGFEFQDLGGLERPLSDYAQAHGFSRTPLAAPFLEQHITLWLRQP
jgi:hypothetical protein